MPGLSALDRRTRAQGRARPGGHGRSKAFLVTQDGRVDGFAIAVLACPVGPTGAMVAAAMARTRAGGRRGPHGAAAVYRVQGLLHLGLLDRQAKVPIDLGRWGVAGAQGEEAQAHGAGA